MLLLMLLAVLEGHGSLTAVGVTFAFFGWAAVAAAWARHRGRPGARGSVGDPFAMGLLMAAPFVGAGVGGHGHTGTIASPGSGLVVVFGVGVVVGWVVLRGGADVGFWVCLSTMTGMLVMMVIPA